MLVKSAVINEIIICEPRIDNRTVSKIQKNGITPKIYLKLSSIKNAITGIKRIMFIALYKVAASILFFEKAVIANVDAGEISEKTMDKNIISGKLKWINPFSNSIKAEKVKPKTEAIKILLFRIKFEGTGSIRSITSIFSSRSSSKIKLNK